MIFERVVIEDFGVYGGRQEVELSPEPDRPIILFGGMNGGGKTTLLDAIQLALYGAKARLSNRGRMGYKDYLRSSIHRGADLSDGASITLSFRRYSEGEPHDYELRRAWRLSPKGIEEHLEVLKDGLRDEVLTAHWPETIAGYLPDRLAHLFFFDGEQIKDLAEGQSAAEIIGTAIDGLLGLDLLTRLTGDLKVFERGVRDEQLARAQETEAAQRLRQAEGELSEIAREIEQLAVERGQVTNASGQAAKLLEKAEGDFKDAGGELFLRREELEARNDALQARKAELEGELRGLLAGPLPLALVDGLLAQVAQQAERETEIRRARVLVEVLETRDTKLLQTLGGSDQSPGVPPDLLQRLRETLEQDRTEYAGLVHEPLVLQGSDRLPSQIAHLRQVVLPEAREKARVLREALENVEDELARLAQELEQVPMAERIAELQAAIDQARADYASKRGALDALNQRDELLKKQRAAVEARIASLTLQDLDSRQDEDHRDRLLKHSARVRGTLSTLHARVMRRHAERLEALMLESFKQLLHKPGLVQDLRIDPERFGVVLRGPDGQPLPFDRLSAGERQLLATAMLWGLARASGRPIPTIIDTPLGRLDSSHRRNLVERYFPNAAHQVILLSTDEEIVGVYRDTIAPFVAKSYKLVHCPVKGATEIKKGYFDAYEAAS
ncbi:DNA sulfur modification protein DndD [Thioflavicoccus mobilis 8321]|uniref:DNA sulfur modification protein DndD n=1 Tax=Thioflavicoccus mobilis 8321 TaxID=765912 RepID=L0H1G2_9GAMM|nr:DNA sulfur modification protein DndD [Thioflavicoccus mobilis]AGA91424.1 DNA sulfur modification protein DndD [Thioflavicoccus mobilis 8321]